MLTRLKVTGFKNLIDVDVRLGPFTCIAGVNGSGKSNLFDAIQFLSALTNETLLDAALSVRAEKGRTANIRNLFHRVGEDYDDEMVFETEMIVPRIGVDDLGQQAEAAITFLKYRIVIEYRYDEDLPSRGSLQLKSEDLTHINISSAYANLPFKHTPVWRNSVVKGRRMSPLISTDTASGMIRLHQDGSGGQPRSYRASSLPRIVLSSVNAIESPTALLARREMQSWRLLQLEPSALRKPDEFTTPPGLGSDGSHLPATLDYLARVKKNGNQPVPSGQAPHVYDQVSSRLADLIDDVREIHVDRDERRQLLTIEVKDRSGTTLPARSLSDGTLRFLALAVILLDPEANGVICLEEPENGIHPERIPAMLQLLQDIAMDSESILSSDNPLRQVIINTHSPAVVQGVLDDSLLVAESKEMVRSGKRFKAARFSWLPDTWRQTADPDVHCVSRGNLLAYLSPASAFGRYNFSAQPASGRTRPRRVMDRPDVKATMLLDADDLQ